MTVPEKIFDFLKKNRKSAYCDDCLKDKLSLKQRQQAEQVTATLCLCSDFIRTTGCCSVCETDKKVIIAR